MALLDGFGRPLTTLRISVTSACNFSCFFCHSEGEVCPANGSRGLLTARDYAVVAEACKKLGISRFKLTGGEPLLRPDLAEIVRTISSYGDPKDLSLTTNGFYLREKAAELLESGLQRVNVSLHTLKRERFKLLTGVDCLPRVVEAVKHAADQPFREVKVNVVLLRGFNTDELGSFVEFAASVNATLQVIELHPVGAGAAVFSRYHEPLSGVISALEGRVSKVEIRREQHNRPVLVLDNGVKVEIVSPVNNPSFCAGCNRVRLTSDGMLSPCLNSCERVDVRSVLLDSTLTRDERVGRVMERILEVNRLRRPYYGHAAHVPAKAYADVRQLPPWTGRPGALDTR